MVKSTSMPAPAMTWRATDRCVNKGFIRGLADLILLSQRLFLTFDHQDTPETKDNPLPLNKHLFLRKLSHPKMVNEPG